MPALSNERESSQGDDPPGAQHAAPPNVSHYPGQFHRNRHIWHRTSWLGIIALILGTALLLAAFGMLLFIWVEASRASRNESISLFWSNVAFSGWTTRVVTICTAAIRFAISSQATISMAMIAALFLESAGSTAFNLPAMSVFRATSPSPLSLLGHLRFSQASAALYSVLVLITALLALISQFTSTILLSDFGRSNITRVFEAEEIFYVGSDYAAAYNSLAMAPPTYWRFAEKSGPPIEKEGFVDTGLSIRAAIPLDDKSHRLGLQSYEGPTVVFDTRAFCVRPNLANVTLDNAGELPYLKGNITLDNPFLPVTLATRGSVFSFACAQGTTQGSTPFGSHGETSICNIPIRHQSNLPSWVPVNKGAYHAAFGVVVSHEKDNFKGAELSAFDEEDMGNDFNESDLDYPDYDNLSFGDRGVWKTILNPDDRLVFSFSLCFSTHGSVSSNVTMSGFSSQAEPGIRYTPNPEISRSKGGWNRRMGPIGSIDTLAIRRYLGVTDEDLSLRDRGILSLDSSNMSIDDAPSISAGFEIGDNDSFFVASFDPLIDYGPKGAHEKTSAVIHDILNSTDNPAYVIQALATQVWLMEYYDKRFYFDKSGLATYFTSETVLIPVRWAGLYGTIAMLLLHHAVVALIFFLFLTHTSVSMIGNFWPAVAQVVSDDTILLLRQADGMLDLEVEAVLATCWKEKGVVQKRKNGRREFGSR